MFGGWAGWFSTTRITTRSFNTSEDFNQRLLYGLLCGIGAWVSTGWPVGVALAVMTGVWGPKILKDRKQAEQAIVRTEAVASWAEHLRDVVSASAGISEALVATARVAPKPIETEVRDLARRLRREDPDTALAAFAADVDDATADQVVVTLRLAMTERGERLSEVLSSIAEAAREQAKMERFVAAGRSKLWRQVVIITVVMFGVFGLMMLMQPTYLAPYGTFSGQLVLLSIGALWATSIKSMVRLAQGKAKPRILDAGRVSETRGTLTDTDLAAYGVGS